MQLICSKGHQVTSGSQFCHHCGEKLPGSNPQTQAATPNGNQPPALPPGTNLSDRFIIQQQLGQGGFGRTYLAENTSRFNEPIAIKEFMPLAQGTQGLQKAEELFQREAKTLYQLQHPQIPRFWETFRQSNRIFIVQDFIEGQTYYSLLLNRLKQGRCFTEPEIIEFLKGILPVLSYLHSKGVIHRDISPDNIILRTKDNLPVVIDLGGVKQVAIQVTTQMVNSQNSGLITPTLLGKVGYAPDEQMRLGIVAPHSDLYALAVTSIVLMTGKQPQELIEPSTMTWIWERELTVSPLLTQILKRMLAPEPIDRFQSSNEVLQALNANSSLPNSGSVASSGSGNYTTNNSSSIPNSPVNSAATVLSGNRAKNKRALFLILALLMIGGVLSVVVYRWWTQNKVINTFDRVQNVPSGLFNYGGSTTWAPIRGQVDPVIKNTWPQFRFIYTQPISEPPGSGPGIVMLLDNQLAFSQSSRPIKDSEYKKAQERGFSIKEIPVAIDGIAVAVNPSLNIPGLTIAQLKDIYTGKITNWSQVGGPNLPIKPYSRPIAAGGTVDFFVENVLENQSFGKNIEFSSTTTEALQKVEANPGSIYYASAPEVVPECDIKSLPIGRQPGLLIPPYQVPLVPPSECPAKRNQVNAIAFQNNQYPITRRLFVIVKQNNEIDEQAGTAYANLLLTPQGQELIAKAGFVPLR